MNSIRKFFTRPTGNSIVRRPNVPDDISSIDESDFDTSVSDSISTGSELVDFDPSRPQNNIGSIRIRESNDVTIGNRIIYRGPVTIQQQVITQRHVPQAGTSTGNRIANAPRQPALTFEAAGSLRIVERSEWFARLPVKELEPLEQPAIRVIIAYTAGQFSTTRNECVETVRDIQEYHIDVKGWDDIAYNFLVGGDCSIYVGRGWDYRGAHSREYNRRSICIAFMGTFSINPPPDRALQAAQQLIRRGVELGKIAEDYRLYGARQLIPTTSPGRLICGIIQTWDHWTDEVIPP